MAGAATGQLFDTHRTRIEEIINKNVEVFLPMLDPFWRKSIVTSQGVGPADAMGRDFYIHKIFVGSFTGVIEGGWGTLYNDFVLFGDESGFSNLGAKFFRQSPSRNFPDPTEGPNAKPYRFTVPMRSMVANLGITLAELQAEATPAFIGQVVAPKLEGFARNWAHTLCNYAYLSQNSGYSLAQYSAPTATANISGTSAYQWTFNPANYAVDRFAVGMRVDLYNNSSGSPGTTRRNVKGGVRVKVFVKAVDEIGASGTGPVVTLVSESDPTTWDVSYNPNGNSPSGANVDHVVYANSNLASAFTGIAGINSYLKYGDSSGDTASDSNCLLGPERVSDSTLGGAINVNTHPEFKSFTAAVSGPLTEHYLRKVLRRYHAAKNKYGQYIDCLVASDGVWLAYEATKIGRERIDRTDRLSSLQTQGTRGDYLEGFNFSFDGRQYEGYTSTYIEDGVCYGIRKGGNNWKRYVPPDPAGAQSMGQVPSFIPFRFVANILAGHGSNRLPYRDANGRLTEMSEMPGMMRMQIVPEQASGLKLTSITTDRIYGT